MTLPLCFIVQEKLYTLVSRLRARTPFASHLSFLTFLGALSSSRVRSFGVEDAWSEGRACSITPASSCVIELGGFALSPPGRMMIASARQPLLLQAAVTEQLSIGISLRTLRQLAIVGVAPICSRVRRADPEQTNECFMKGRQSLRWMLRGLCVICACRIVAQSSPASPLIDSSRYAPILLVTFTKSDSCFDASKTIYCVRNCSQPTRFHLSFCTSNWFGHGTAPSGRSQLLHILENRREASVQVETRQCREDSVTAYSSRTVN